MIISLFDRNLFYNITQTGDLKMKKLLWLDDFRNPTEYLTADYDITWGRKI